MSRRWLESIRNRFFGTRQTSRQSRRKPDLSLEVLEDRTVPATLAEVGGGLTIILDQPGEQLSIVSNGTTYGLSSNAAFVANAVPGTRVAASGNTATVTAAGLAAYDTINIIDNNAQNTRVTFANSGANAYSDNFTVTLDDDTAVAAGEQSVVFAGNSAFGASGLTVSTTRNIFVQAGASVTASTGNISLSANAAGTTTGDFTGIAVDGTISAGTGTVTVNGTGGSGTGNANVGVRVQGSGAQVTSAGGNVAVTGKGGRGAADGHGVVVSAGGVISAGGMGAATVSGTGGIGNRSDFRFFGVRIEGAGSQITSSGGAVTVTGQGGDSGYPVNTGNGVNQPTRDYGVSLAGGGVITSGGTGAVNVTGTGGASNGNFEIGVVVEGTGSQITSSGGNVTVTGTGGAATEQSDSYGVHLNAGGVITAGGAGTVTVTGTGGGGPGAIVAYAHHTGVRIEGGSQITSSGGGVTVAGVGGGMGSTHDDYGIHIRSGGMITAGQTGTVTVSGTGGTGFGEFEIGVVIQDANSKITSSGGNVLVTGLGRGNTSSGRSAYGIDLFNGGVITAGGVGTVTVVGTGAGGGNGDNFGVVVEGSGSQITSSSGNVAVTGTGGGTQNSSQGYGVLLRNSGRILAGAIGTVTVSGTGGSASGGSNHGVRVEGPTSVITSSGGAVSVTGTGGGSIASSQDYGVDVAAGGSIEAGGMGSVTVTGTGGKGVGQFEIGVVLENANSRITSSGGNVTVIGTGGGTGNARQAYGVDVAGGSRITAGSAGTVTVTGTGGGASGDEQYGVRVEGGSQIATAGGNVSVTGQGGGTGASSTNIGVDVVGGSSILAGGMGTVTVMGTGGTSGGAFNDGVYVTGGAIRSSGGAVSVTGQGGSGGARNAVGVVVATVGPATTISAGGSGTLTITGTGGGTGTGTDNNGVVVLGAAASVTTQAGSLTITGTAGGGTAQFGVALRSGGKVMSQTGAILIDGKKSAGGLSGDVQLNGPVTTAGGNITIRADRDVIGDANGDVSTGAGGGNITITADQDATGAANDAGTIQLAGDLTAGIGQVTLSLPDTDGFLNGNVVSAGRLEKRGGGTLQLNGQANTPQITDIITGTLLVNGKSLSVLVTGVESGATLGGTGSIAGDVLVRNGGTITGGTVGTVGTLTVGTLSFDGGTYQADLSGNTSDTIVTSGAVDLQAPAQGTFVLNVLGTGGTATGGTYTFIDNQGAGAIVDPPLANALEGGTATVNGQNGIYSYVGGTGNDFTLTVSSGPVGTFTGTAASENFRLVRTATTIELYSVSTITVGANGSINFTTPTLLRTFDATTTVFVDINGGGGSDNLMIDYSGVAGLENVDVEFTGGGAGTSSGLFVNGGTFGSQEYVYFNATDGAIGNYADPAFANLRSIIFYEGLSPLVNNSIVTDISFDLPMSGNVQAMLGDDGTPGNTLSRFSSNPTAFERTDFRNPTGTLFVNRGSDTDDLAVTSLPDFNAGLTIGDGLNPFDRLTMTGTVTLAANKNLTADATTITLGDTNAPIVPAVVTLSGSGAATLTAVKSVAVIAAGSSLTTVDGDITLSGNVSGSATGTFVGVNVGQAVVQATGGGAITLTGQGGDTGSSQRGVQVESGGRVLSNTGTITVIGTGGKSSANQNAGVAVSGTLDGLPSGIPAQIRSAAGNVVVTGAGGGAGASQQDRGVQVSTFGVISAGGAGSVNITGTGGAVGSNAIGVLVSDVGQIRAEGTGAVTVTGAGGSGTGDLNAGVLVTSRATINSAGGDVTVTGTGGGSGAANSAEGVLVAGSAADPTSISAGGGGSVTVAGTGGGGTGAGNNGVQVVGATARITAGTGAVSITGTAGNGTGQFGVSLQSGGAVTTTTGAVLIDGKKPSGGLSGDVQLNGPVTTAGGNITIRADRDIIGNASGDISTGAGGGNITITANQDATGTPNDAGTVQLAGDLTAGGGSGIIRLGLTDTDGFLNGNVLSTNQFIKEGTGTLAMNGTANTYGNTFAGTGTLLLNGVKTGAGSTVVALAGTFGGTGSTTDSVSVGSGGTITGGTVGGVGTLTVGGLEFRGGTFQADLAGDTSDTIVVTNGPVNLNSGSQGVFNLNVLGGTTTTGHIFTFINNTAAGAIQNPPLANAPEGGTVPVNGKLGFYTYTGGTGGNDFTLTASSTSSLADLRLNLSGPASVTAGNNVTYTITVLNAGPTAATLATIGDRLPAGTTFVSLTQTSGPAFTIIAPVGSSPAGAFIQTFASGATATFALVVRADTPGTISNTASVGGSGTDPVPANNTATVTTTVNPPQADVGVVKTGPATIIPGQDLTYTITVSNTGPDSAQFVSITDSLPASTTFVSFSQATGPAFILSTLPVGSTGTVAASILALKSGQKATFTLTVRVDPDLAGGGTLSNTVYSATTTADTNPGNDTSAVTTTLAAPQADLQVTKTGPASVLADQDLTYTISITNAGPSNADLPIFVDALPAGTTFVSLTQTSGPAFTLTTPMPGSGGTVDGTATSFPAGQTATFTFVVHVDAGTSGTIRNTAQIFSSTSDPSPANNSGIVATSVTIPDDLVIRTTAPATVDPGTNLTYTITLTNTGPSDATTVVVADNIPGNTTFVSLTSSDPNFNATTPGIGGTGLVSLTANTFPAGSSATFTLTVLVDPTFVSGTITNTAQVSGVPTDSDPNNNSSTTTTAIAQADLNVSKNGPATAVAGEDLTYTITFFNSGPDAATNVMISDNIPTGTLFVSLTQNSGGAGFSTSTPAPGNSGTVTITTSSLAVGTVATYTLVVHVPAGLTGGFIRNTATGTTLTPDADPTNDSSAVMTTITTQADLQVSKSGAVAVLAGQELTYTLTVTNTGPSNAVDVSIGDALPAGTTFVSLNQNSGPNFNTSTPAVGSNGTVTLDTTFLAAGASATFTLVVKVAVVSPSTLHNTATGTTSTPDTDPSNNASTVSTTVTPLQLFVVGEGHAGRGRVRAYYPNDPTRTVLFELTPFPGFNGAIRVTTGDVTGDGRDDIIVGTSDGPVGRVKVYDGTTGMQVPGPIGDFRPFGSSWTGGVFVAAGDVNLDGRAEIFVTQATTGNQVRVYDGANGQRLQSFRAFPTYNGGLTVAAGDVDLDGRADAIVGQRTGAGRVRTFNVAGANVQALNTFTGFSGGVFVAAGDISGSARAEIIVGRRTNLPHLVSVLDGASGTTLGSVAPFPGSFQRGLRVSTIDADGDGKVEVLVGAGLDVLGPRVELLGGLTLTELDAFFAYDQMFQGGVLVG